MKGYLSRQTNGLYMLTYRKPIWAELSRTGIWDFYIEYGDPLGVRNLCTYSARVLFNVVDLPVGYTVRVELKGEAFGGFVRVSASGQSDRDLS